MPRCCSKTTKCSNSLLHSGRNASVVKDASESSSSSFLPSKAWCLCMAPLCCKAQPLRTSCSLTIGVDLLRARANNTAARSAFLIKPPDSSYFSATASQSTDSSVTTFPFATRPSQIAFLSDAPGGAYSTTVLIRRCIASSSSAGRFVARNTRPLHFSISWSIARNNRSAPPWSLVRNNASHSSKNNTASDISASRNRPLRSASTSSPPWWCLPRNDAKSTCKTRFFSSLATPCTVIVLPVPEGPHRSTTKPLP
mmetsp:Transcript_2165/g.6044  ORF Transcript_2165/g.6044 Transcript_2165/m.6044 type:complete len:254 (+) Transcript_2165:942-1703(+)